MKIKANRTEVMECMAKAVNRLIKEGAFDNDYSDSMQSACGTLEEFDTSAPDDPEGLNDDWTITIPSDVIFESGAFDDYEDDSYTKMFAPEYNVVTDYDGNIKDDDGLMKDIKNAVDPSMVETVVNAIEEYIKSNELEMYDYDDRMY